MLFISSFQILWAEAGYGYPKLLWPPVGRCGHLLGLHGLFSSKDVRTWYIYYKKTWRISYLKKLGNLYFVENLDSRIYVSYILEFIFLYIVGSMVFGFFRVFSYFAICNFIYLSVSIVLFFQEIVYSFGITIFNSKSKKQICTL